MRDDRIVLKNTGNEMKRYHRLLLPILAELIALFIIVMPLLHESETHDLFQTSSVTEDSVESARINLGRGIYAFQLDYRMEAVDDDIPDDTMLVFYQDGIRGRPLERSHPYLISIREQQIRGRVLLGDYEQAGFFAQISRGSAKELQIIRLSITYLKNLSIVHALIKWCMIFAVINFVLYVCLAPSTRIRNLLQQNAIVVCVCLFAVFVASLPVFSERITCGDDMEFHIYRIKGIAEALRNGDPAARIQPGWLGGYGYAVGVGYGQLLLYPSALLYLCGFSVEVAYRFYLLLINLISFCSAYYCGKVITGYKTYAAVCGLMYTLSFYRLTNLFPRSAAGEAGAMAFLPLIAAGLFIIYRSEEDQDHFAGIRCLVLGATGVLQTHVISVILTIWFLVLFFILFARETICVPRIKTMLKALGYTVMVNLWFLVPFLDYVRLEMFSATGDHGGGHSAMAAVVTPFSKLFLSQNEALWMTFGSASLLLLCLSILVTITKGTMRDKRMMVKLIILTCVFLIASSDLFPYTWMLVHMPRTYHVLSTIQFPWRFLSLSCVMLMVLLAYVIRTVTSMEASDEKGTASRIVVGVVAALGVLSGLQFMEDYRNGDESYIVWDSFRVACAMEYILPDGVDEKTLTNHGWPALPDSDFADTVAETGGLTMRAEVEDAEPRERFIDFPRMNYYGYHASGTQGEMTISDGPNRNVRVHVPAGYTGAVQIAFRTPWYWHLAGIVSVLFILYFKRHGTGKSST